MWSLTRPLLGLILINEQNFEEIKIETIQKAYSTQDKQELAFEALNSLMDNITRTLTQKNKDAFARNFTQMRAKLVSLGN